MGDIHASGTHNLGPDWSHCGVLRGCFITGLDSGDSLEICSLAPCRSERVHTQTIPVFHRPLSAEMADVKNTLMYTAANLGLCTHDLTIKAETLGLLRLWQQKPHFY